MTADSIPRRIVKRFVVPILGQSVRETIQAIAKVKDILDGSWARKEEPELEWVKEFVRSGDTVIDVGANFGLYSYHLSKRVGTKGRVYAFEPVPSTYKSLCIVARLLRLTNVDIINKGCSDTSGEVTFRVPVSDAGTISAGLAFIDMDASRRNERLSESTYQRTRAVNATVVRLDSYLLGLSQLRLIKVDVEGADLLVLRGASGLIDEHRPGVLIEVEQRYMDSYGVSKDDVKAFFDDRGYGMYQWDATRGLERRTLDEMKEGNWIFLPDELQTAQ